jgi:hypothetical protein
MIEGTVEIRFEIRRGDKYRARVQVVLPSRSDVKCNHYLFGEQGLTWFVSQKVLLRTIHSNQQLDVQTGCHCNRNVLSVSRPASIMELSVFEMVRKR